MRTPFLGLMILGCGDVNEHWVILSKLAFVTLNFVGLLFHLANHLLESRLISSFECLVTLALARFTHIQIIHAHFLFVNFYFWQLAVWYFWSSLFPHWHSHVDLILIRFFQELSWFSINYIIEGLMLLSFNPSILHWVTDA